MVDWLSLAPGATSTSGENGSAADQTPGEEGKTTEQPRDVTANVVLTSKGKTELLAATPVSGLKIDVDSRDGIVMLTGTVSSAAQRDRALTLARETEGVRAVVDRLKVGT